MCARSISASSITFEDFEAEFAGKRYEYVDGQPLPMGDEVQDAGGQVIVTPTKAEHGLLVDEITFVLGGFVRQRKLGRLFGAETGFLMQSDPPELRAADLAFYSRDRLNAIKPGEWLPFPPDLAVEVISEHDRAADIRRKARAYLENGTRLLWFFFPFDREVEVYRPDSPVQLLSAADILDGGDVLPGFSVPLKDIFAPLDELGK